MYLNVNENDVDTILKTDGGGEDAEASPCTVKKQDDVKDRRMTISELRAICHGSGINTKGMERSQLEQAAQQVQQQGTYFAPSAYKTVPNFHVATSDNNKNDMPTKDHPEGEPIPKEKEPTAVPQKANNEPNKSKPKTKQSISELRAICHGAGINTVGMERSQLEQAAQEVEQRGTYFPTTTTTKSPSPSPPPPTTTTTRRASPPPPSTPPPTDTGKESPSSAKDDDQQPSSSCEEMAEEEYQRILEERRIAEERQKYAAQQKQWRRQQAENLRQMATEQQRRMEELQAAEEERRHRQAVAENLRQMAEAQAKEEASRHEAESRRQQHQQWAQWQKQQQLAELQRQQQLKQHQKEKAEEERRRRQQEAEWRRQQQYQQQQRQQQQQQQFQQQQFHQWQQQQRQWQQANTNGRNSSSPPPPPAAAPPPQSRQQYHHPPQAPSPPSPPKQQRHSPSPPPPPQQQPQQRQRTPTPPKAAGDDVADDGVLGLIKQDILQQWALQAPQYQFLKPIQQLLISIHTVFPPAFGMSSHDYFQKWNRVAKSDLTLLENPNQLDSDRLKKTVRKVRFFLHPDKLPKNLSPEQYYILKLVWDIVSDAWEIYQNQRK